MYSVKITVSCDELIYALNNDGIFRGEELELANDESVHVFGRETKFDTCIITKKPAICVSVFARGV